MRVLPSLDGGASEHTPRVRPESGPKRVYIRNSDLERWGYTSTCNRCMLMREGKSAAGKALTDACRTRIEEAMKEAKDDRLAAAERRQTAVEVGRDYRLTAAASAAAQEAISDWVIEFGSDTEIEFVGARQRTTPNTQFGGSSSSNVPLPRSTQAGAPAAAHGGRGGETRGQKRHGSRLRTA
jgi:hypothetical protein